MVNFSAGQPIGPTAIQDIFANIEGLCDQLGQEYGRIQCEEISGTIDNNECIEIPNPLASKLENNSGIVDQKIIAFALYPNIIYTASTSENQFATSLSWTVSIKCGGNVVYTDSGSSNSLRLVQAHIDCPRNDVIEICFDASATGSFGAQVSASARYCGVVLCAGNETRTLTGLFKPPPLPEGCCYGREHLYLASQNLDALCRSLLSNRAQYAYCVQGESTEIDSLVVSANLPADTQYFVWGDVFICYRNDSQDSDWSIKVDPFIGCDSSNSECIGLDEVVPKSREEGNDVGITQCRTIPVITCGSCPAGESITAGLTYDAECDPEVPTAVGSGRVVITSVRQKYCVWLFSDVQIDGLPPATDLVLGSCLTDGSLLPLQEKYEALKSIISELSFVNVTRRNIGPLSGAGPQDWLFQSAQPWPPAFPLPRPVPEDPPPTKKWNMDVRVCSALSDANIALVKTIQNAVGILKFEIKCGSTVLIERETSWQMHRVGGSDFDQYEDLRVKCLSFSDCIECAIDEEIRVCVEFSINRVFAGIQVADYGVVDLKIAKAFCF